MIWLILLTAWILISLPVGLFIGAFIDAGAGGGEQMSFSTGELALIAIAVALWMYVLFGADLL